MDALLNEFAPLVVEPAAAQQVRGDALGLAQHWLVYLPECPAKAEALALLRGAVERACAAACAA